MRTHRLIIILLLAAVATVSRAQSDTIVVTGTVYNQHTRESEPYCFVQLLQDKMPKVSCLSDSNGIFSFDSLPTGIYTLQVSVGRTMLYKTDFELSESAYISIYVDTLQFISLRPFNVSAPRRTPHMLGDRLITSANDDRLWNFSGQMGDSGPASKDLSVRCRKGSLLDGTVPIWVLCNEPWDPQPTSTATEQPSDSTVAKKE